MNAGVKAGRRAVETLTEILKRAGWKSVEVVEDPDVAHNSTGLTLAVGSAVPSATRHAHSQCPTRSRLCPDLSN